MLIVREALGGVDRYKDFSNALAISDHTLSRRLSHLQDIGVLQRDDLAPARYHLTPAGEDLAPVLAVLGDWPCAGYRSSRRLVPCSSGASNAPLGNGAENVSTKQSW